MRLELYEAGFWCSPTIDFKKGIKTAFQHFKTWRRERKIDCSQPCFSAKHVPWCHYKFEPFTCSLLPSNSRSFEFQKYKVTVGDATEEALWNLKAYNGRVVAAWLSDCCLELSRQHPGNHYFSVMAACMPATENL